MRYKNVRCDLEGTLTDQAEGSANSHMNAEAQRGREG